MCPPKSHNAYRKESSDLSTLNAPYKEQGHHHQVPGAPVSDRSLFLDVSAVVEERTELVPMITFTLKVVHFRFTEGFHMNHLIWSMQGQ